MFIYFSQLARYCTHFRAILKTNWHIKRIALACSMNMAFLHTYASHLPSEYAFVNLNISLGKTYDKEKLKTFNAQYCKMNKAAFQLGQENKTLLLILQNNNASDIVTISKIYLTNIRGIDAYESMFYEILQAALPKIENELTDQKKRIANQNTTLDLVFAISCLWIVYNLFPK